MSAAADLLAKQVERLSVEGEAKDAKIRELELISEGVDSEAKTAEVLAKQITRLSKEGEEKDAKIAELELLSEGLDSDAKDAKIKKLEEKIEALEQSNEYYLADTDEYVKEIKELKKELNDAGVTAPQKLVTPRKQRSGQQSGWLMYRKEVSKQVRESILKSGMKPKRGDVLKIVGEKWKAEGKELQADWILKAEGVANQEELKVNEMMKYLSECHLITKKEIIKPLANYILSCLNEEGVVVKK